MLQVDFFKNAQWVDAPRTQAPHFNRARFSVIRGHFSASEVKKATLNVLGFGFFKCYINGVCVNPDTFLPLASEYEPFNEPKGEVFSGHRVYVPSFDITPYVQSGDNVIAISYGGGWYTYRPRWYGFPKAIYSITVESENSTESFGSGTHCRAGGSNVTDYDLTKFEVQDHTACGAFWKADFDDSSWEHAVLTELPNTQYCANQSPIDTLIEERPVVRLNSGVYDCGENTTGYPVLRLCAKAGETVSVRFSEEVLPNGSLDMSHNHAQEFRVVANGEEMLVQPEYTWFGFRYFEVTGDAVPVCVKVVHADVPVTATFDSDNETLNWIFNTFTHTMRTNMHTGMPSDCPHLERRGYTGDGQLTCHASLTLLDSRAFYEKWLQDIADSQDALSGHIQYTAPYIQSGGGPGGWGCAIVEVPYQLYRHFGDQQILAKYYDNMRRYMDYLDKHSEFGLVTSDKAGEWCLGDWCGPNILYADKDITFHNQQVFLPAPLVNTYFMVKSLKRMVEIARVIGREVDIAEYERKINLRSRAITAAYFNAFDGNFIMNVQGANAFAVDLGLGNGKTYANMVNYYTKLGGLDTGIFATDILIRNLFEKGDGELAAELLTADGPLGYTRWRKNGATTFHEYWDSSRSRSHNHPMFGAPAVYLFEHLLGIRQAEGSAAYRNLVIEPKAVAKFGRMSGSLQTAAGKIAVSYVKRNNAVEFKILIPEGVQAVFRCENREIELKSGDNIFCIG